MPSLLAALAAAVTALSAPNPGRTAVPAAAPATVVDRGGFRDSMRKLWEDHVTWTRLYIVSAVAGLPDAGPAAGRLLQNQADIGNAIKPFYGDAAGDRLTALLRQHILIAADLVTAAKAGKDTDVQSASARWYANSDEIADFLSDANPDEWPRATLRAEMRHHLDLTLNEAKARLGADWAGDISAYDAIHQHILGMADMLAAGIIRQFPRLFDQ